MAANTVSFNTDPEISDNALEIVAKWLSCNGEAWGVGPTLVFASAAALFLYNELQATMVLGAGDRELNISLLETSLVTTMILGMLALMIHLWVCSMRFFQYYLDTIIRDSPNIILEMTTAGLFGAQAPTPSALGPLTRFLKQQQPQIHITVCWFLSLCYADYVRKNYCRHFNMPYLEQWQAEVHERALRGVHKTVAKVNSFIGAIQQRLRAYTQPPAATAGTGTANTCGQTNANVLTPSEVRLRMHTEASDITTDAYEKLKAYIKATRCPCGSDANKNNSSSSQVDKKEVTFENLTTDNRFLSQTCLESNRSKTVINKNINLPSDQP